MHLEHGPLTAVFRAIAKALGFAGPSGAYAAFQAGLRQAVRPAADEARALVLERLDAMLLACWRQAAAGDLTAVDRVLRIEAQRCALLGLNAPRRHEPSGPAGGAIELAVVDARERLKAKLTELAARRAALPAPAEAAGGGAA